mmetsp:Transcript_17077/g.41556  ORF Transcript_17077/g.41556 Transcript_17077/m.41556 type:complete len:371 (-) Transcript_17077:67-1179(-)
MAVDQTTRHCRSVYSAWLGHNESDETSKNPVFKNKLRNSCSKQLHTITNVSRRLLSCPIAKREAQSGDSRDGPQSQKMCKESTSVFKELERAISETASKTKQRIEKRRRRERTLNGFQSCPSSFESRQAAAQRLRELIRQKHYLNVNDRNGFHEEAFNGPDRIDEAAREDCNVFEPSMSWQETLDWDKALHDLSMAEQNGGALSTKTYVSGGATSASSSPDRSTSNSSIEKLSELLDQYLDQQPTTLDFSSLPERKTECKSSRSTSSIDKLGALLGDYFDKQKTSFVPPLERKKECKIIIEDSSFHTQVKKATESLSYSSGLTECSSEDSSIDCSAIVEHENNVTEQFGAYQEDFHLYRELEASMKRHVV